MEHLIEEVTIDKAVLTRWIKTLEGLPVTSQALQDVIASMKYFR